MSHVLPVPLTPLLGRERELDETARLLEHARLLTITGAGGSGKTRLALELAHQVAGRYGRAIWVDLAPIADGNLIAGQILNTIGLRESPTFDDVDLVIEALRGRSHLLILDNCEHVVDAAAVVAEKILRSSAQTTMLVTTREALGWSAVWITLGLAFCGVVYLIYSHHWGGAGLPDENRAEVLGGGDAQRVTFEGSYNVSPRISPDGNKIAYITRNEGKFQVALLDLTNRQTQVITDSERDESPSFAPTGRMILLATVLGGRGVLSAVSADGRFKQRLSAATGGDVREPAWGPFID